MVTLLEMTVLDLGLVVPSTVFQSASLYALVKENVKDSRDGKDTNNMGGQTSNVVITAANSYLPADGFDPGVKMLSESHELDSRIKE